MILTLGEPVPCAKCGHAKSHWPMSFDALWPCQHEDCACPIYVAPPPPPAKLYTQADLDAAYNDGLEFAADLIQGALKALKP